MDIAFLILRKQNTVVEFYIELGKDREGFQEYFSSLRNTFSDLNIYNYKGISRDALLPIPEEYQSVYPSAQEPKAQYLMSDLIEKCCEKYSDEYINMICNLDDCLSVYNLLENKQGYEIIKTSRVNFTHSSDLLGFDIGYWGGDNFSAISDSILLPMWHPIPEHVYREVLPFSNKLNSHLLFENYSEAEEFREYYLSQDWSEKESFEGEICIQKIESVLVEAT